MRILFINPFYKPYLGSTEQVVERLSSEFMLDERVEAVGILASRANSPHRTSPELPAFESIDGVQVFRCPLKPAGMDMASCSLSKCSTSSCRRPEGTG
jgi:hypothetical protein